MPESKHETETLATGIRQRKVLIVDDNHDNADLCAIILRKAGHEVRTAYSGDEALSIAPEFKPDFALLDIGMPGMDGYELAQHMRTNGWSKNMTLIAITGWGHEEDKLRALSAGFDHHLTKPFDVEMLEKMITS